LGKNIISNFLEVLIAGVKLTPRVKDVSTFEGNRRLKMSIYFTVAIFHLPLELLSRY